MKDYQKGVVFRNKMIISWFSAGVSSAVATKKSIEKWDNVQVCYIHIDSQHPDTMRFVMECEKWFGRKITILQSNYKTIIDVFRQFRYINGVAGAKCTGILKKRVRLEYEQDLFVRENSKNIEYIWGYDLSEKHRADRVLETMPQYSHRFPLIEEKIAKKEAHFIIEKAGIKRPAMYELGYNNNNCIGCVKGGKGYWNKIRKDFPEQFSEMAKVEREVGASCINGTYLDELKEGEGRHDIKIIAECDLLCQMKEEDK